MPPKTQTAGHLPDSEKTWNVLGFWNHNVLVSRFSGRFDEAKATKSPLNETKKNTAPQKILVLEDEFPFGQVFLAVGTC